MLNKKLGFLFGALFCFFKYLQDGFWKSVCPIKGSKWCSFILICESWLAAMHLPTALPASPARSFPEIVGGVGEGGDGALISRFSCYCLVRAQRELRETSVTCF